MKFDKDQIEQTRAALHASNEFISQQHHAKVPPEHVTDAVNIICDMAISSLSSPEATARWIPVEERLPENRQIVIVSGGTARYLDGIWYTGMEEPLFRRDIQWRVTHWMPFPSLQPQGRKGET